MEEAKGVVKHVFLAKFKDDVTPERIEELIKDYANLVNLIPPMKSFHWYHLLYVFSFLSHACNAIQQPTQIRAKNINVYTKHKRGQQKVNPIDRKN